MILSIVTYVPLVIWGCLIAGVIGVIGGTIYATHTDNPTRERYAHTVQVYSIWLFACSLVLGIILDSIFCSGIIGVKCVSIVPYI